jgi:thioredoxin-dependent peroxiredoxin
MLTFVTPCVYYYSIIGIVRSTNMTRKILKPGDPAPDFTLPDHTGTMISLKDLRGSWVILYFYPKDNTPGCTMEAVDFTTLSGIFKKHGALIIGISPDSGESHGRFIGRHGLGVTLLSDTDKQALKQYGVWKKKKLYGREFLGVARSTFLIDPAGALRRMWSPVRVKGHAGEVLEAVRELS